MSGMRTYKLDYRQWTEAYRTVLALQETVNGSGLDPFLQELIKLRASQINGCEFCLDMHTKDALAIGESPERIASLRDWRNSSAFDARESAALALTEGVTLLSADHVPDSLLDEARQQFSEEEVVRLLYTIVAINMWNRLAGVGKPPVGVYRSQRTRMTNARSVTG